MAAHAHAKPRRAATQPARRPQTAKRPVSAPRELHARPRPRALARARVAGGVVSIVVVAALLAGIVALNVAVLRLNMEVERLDVQKERLLSENAALASELSTGAAAARIERLARRQLGLVEPAKTTYVHVPPSGR